MGAGLLFQLLAAGLQLWDDKEKAKYQDKYISLHKDWYEEFNKTRDQRDNSRIDSIEFELRVLATSFAARVGKPDVGA